MTLTYLSALFLLALIGGVLGSLLVRYFLTGRGRRWFGKWLPRRPLEASITEMMLGLSTDPHSGTVTLIVEGPGPDRLHVPLPAVAAREFARQMFIAAEIAEGRPDARTTIQ